MFITFEGGEGVGKSTQIELLRRHFQGQGRQVVTTREPGGTDFANKLRAIMLEQELPDPLTEYSLISTARRDHILNFIKPKIASGNIVLCDRFFDSSVVYQGVVKGLDISKMNQIHNIINDGFLPDYTILLDLEIESSQQRINFRNANTNVPTNHYDARDLAFHKKIRDGFLHLASLYPDRIKIASADGDEQMVLQRILKIIDSLQL